MMRHDQGGKGCFVPTGLASRMVTEFSGGSRIGNWNLFYAGVVWLKFNHTPVHFTDNEDHADLRER
jgi:hypothetical protein